MKLNRRLFLLSTTATAAALAARTNAQTSGNEEEKEDLSKKFFCGEPCLQAAAPTSMGIAWAVGSLANGWVEFGEKPDLSDARRVVCGEGAPGITDFDEIAVRVRLTGLKPNTKYYYRTKTEFVNYINNYKRKSLQKVTGDIHSFTTLGESGRSHFCVMNDTHARWIPFSRVTAKIRELAPAVMVWNGDASNQTENPETGVEIFLNPPKSAGYCSDIPLLWNNGNHDFRGIWNRSLDRFMMVRLPSERDSRDWALSRNWAVRQGDIAMIGLDTGEDKPDAHPQFVGLVNSEPYRIAQTQWLRDQFERPEIKSAPHKVAFCHIPLFDSNPVSNPGDVVGDGNGRYKPDFAVWQRQCANLWAPIFKENGVKLLIAAHCHNYRFDPATPDRPWAQIVGGGCSESPTNSYATVIEGRVEDGKLKITVHNVNAGTIAGEHVF